MVTRRTLLAIAYFILLLAPELFAEGRSIRGVVVDPTGAIVSDAKVILVDLRTLETMQTATNYKGEFNFGLKAAGRYALIAGGPQCFLSEVKTFRWKRIPSQIELKLKLDPECKVVE